MSETTDTKLGYMDFVNDARTILVTIWDDGTTTLVTVQFREHPSHTWGPPTVLKLAEIRK